jgi:HEAT repeat protein
MTPETASLVAHYLLEWDSRGWASAYHSLIELGPEILPTLEDRFAGSRNSVFRAALVELARQLHSAEAIGLFGAALRDPAPEVWKEALDGLVDLASPESIHVLQDGLQQSPPRGTSPEDWSSWLSEALDQARAALAARSGTA